MIDSVARITMNRPQFNNAQNGRMGLTDFIGIAEAAGYVALPEPLVELAGATRGSASQSLPPRK